MTENAQYKNPLVSSLTGDMPPTFEGGSCISFPTVRLLLVFSSLPKDGWDQKHDPKFSKQKDLHCFSKNKVRGTKKAIKSYGTLIISQARMKSLFSWKFWFLYFWFLFPFLFFQVLYSWFTYNIVTFVRCPFVTRKI